MFLEKELLMVLQQSPLQVPPGMKYLSGQETYVQEIQRPD
jgi:hypothetical protein